MISAKWLKLLNSLQIKKYRKLHQLFLVEGAKSVLEMLHTGYPIQTLFATQSFISEHIRNSKNPGFELYPATEDELVKAGTFQTNNACIAVAPLPENKSLAPGPDEYALLLDGVQDPGNLGTIIRIADWYGITKIICSLDAVDVYNPKTIAGSMGSFMRVQAYYTDLPDYLQMHPEKTVYGAFLDGENVHQTQFDQSGLIVMGSESHGIREPLQPFISRKIHIPRYGAAESLNVGIATAVICDNLRRR